MAKNDYVELMSTLRKLHKGLWNAHDMWLEEDPDEAFQLADIACSVKALWFKLDSLPENYFDLLYMIGGSSNGR